MNMKVIIAGLAAALCVATTDILPPAIKNSTRSAFFPGYQSSNIDHLHPTMKAKVERILARLEAQGYRPQVRSTYRSQDYQDFIYNVSVFQKKYTGQNGFTTTRHSCHTKNLKNGDPAARAVDIRQGISGPHLYLPTRFFREKHAEFYKALGKEAKREGLNWGGNYKKKGLWQEFGLGWDPGHISLNCGEGEW